MNSFISDDVLVEAEREAEAKEAAEAAEAAEAKAGKVANTNGEPLPKQNPVAAQSTPKRVSRKGMFPTWGDLLAILGLFFVTQIITRVIFGIIDIDIPIFSSIEDLATMERRDAEFDLGYKVFLWSIISQPMLLVLFLIYRQVRGGKLWGKVKWSVRGLNPTVLLWGIIMLLSVVVVIEPLMQMLPKPEASYGRGIYMMLSILVVAPIFEELLCRGVIFEAIRAKRGSWAACIISSMIFGLMHIEPQFVLNAFIIGVVLCYLYLRTRSIFAPMIIHSLNNLFAYMLLIFGFNNLTLYEIVGGGTLYTTIYGVAVVVLIISAISIGRQITRLDEEERKKNSALESISEEIKDIKE